MRTRPVVIMFLTVILTAAFFYWQSGYRKADKTAAPKGAIAPVFLKFGLTDNAPVKKNAGDRVLKRSRKVKARRAAPVAGEFPGPKVAVVIDDFGYSMKNVETFLALREPVTFSVLPGLRYSREIAELAAARGFEVILHLPLESGREDAREEADTIRTGMGRNEILLRLKKDTDSLPAIDGVSNHQGSKATSDIAVMTTVMGYLKSRGLFFLDSLTSGRSVCREAARSAGVRYTRRDIFLDNSNETAAIEKQLEELKSLAFKRGRVIAVCHDRPNTAAALARAMPEMAADGIVFVRLSDVVN